MLLLCIIIFFLSFFKTGYTDHTGKFQRKLNEHFFLTDPEVLIWTHFPYCEIESNYSRWQLLDKPLKLDEFNALPKVTPFFFEYNLRIRSRPQNPVVFRFQTELKLTAHKPTRYKYKLYSVEDRENGALNNYVFCQLKEDRLLGSFAICPPTEGMYYFKQCSPCGKIEYYRRSSLPNVNLNEIMATQDVIRVTRLTTLSTLAKNTISPSNHREGLGSTLLESSLRLYSGR
ncbi:UNVERIFIED_CONTAM: hypothetical protein NCL1_54774 [Trichonephila clavipes]